MFKTIQRCTVCGLVTIELFFIPTKVTSQSCALTIAAMCINEYSGKKRSDIYKAQRRYRGKTRIGERINGLFVSDGGE
jgi:hypothetical protein